MSAEEQLGSSKKPRLRMHKGCSVTVQQPWMSIVVPYFDAPAQLEWFIEPLEGVSTPIELIIVDDCSSSPPSATLLGALSHQVRILRVQDRLPWSMSVASNWGFVYASSRRVLRTDLDCRIYEGTDLDDCRALPLEGLAVHRLLRVVSDQGREGFVVVKPHPNAFVCARETFFELGMYDERFRGNYGSDDVDFFDRAERNGRVSRADIYLEGFAGEKQESGDRSVAANQRLLRRKRRGRIANSAKRLPSDIRTTYFKPI